MSVPNAPSYAVGRGKPPRHTRFKKGQSGNPSGKAGPAKLAKQRFHNALYASLEEETMDLMLAKPRGALAQMARQLTLDAAAGRIASTRLLLSLLDEEIAAKIEADEAEESEEGDEQFRERDASEAPTSRAVEMRNEAEPFSLLQGKKQGNGNSITEPAYAAVAADEALRKAGAEARKRTALLGGAAAIAGGGVFRATSPPGRK